jgi:hypothetical protein
MKIHPSHCFPLLPEDELQDLAQDIKKNGLFHPIIVDDEGQLVDGRNRLLACEIAGVEPRFEKLPAGWDARDYMLSVNLMRKSITRSRKAMWLAMAVELGADIDIPAGASGELFKQACQVLRHSRALAQAVLNGGTPLGEALEMVRAAQQTRSAEEVQCARLRNSAPDQYDLVTEGKLKLADAIAILDNRQRREHQARERAHKAAKTIAGPFCANVAALIEGVDLGVNIHLPPGALEQIEQALKLLQAKLPSTK